MSVSGVGDPSGVPAGQPPSKKELAHQMELILEKIIYTIDNAMDGILNLKPAYGKHGDDIHQARGELAYIGRSEGSRTLKRGRSVGGCAVPKALVQKGCQIL